MSSHGILAGGNAEEDDGERLAERWHEQGYNLKYTNLLPQTTTKYSSRRTAICDGVALATSTWGITGSPSILTGIL